MTQRFFILSPDTVFTARVDQSTFTYPLGQVTFDGVGVGAYTDIQENMTVLFGSTAGNDDLGRQRIRKAAGAATLYIGRSSIGNPDGQVSLADNAYITVINDRRIWAKIPAMDGSTIYKDHDLAYVDQTEEIPPKANIAGGAVAATIGGGGTITVTFDGSGSYGNAGATISTYAWDVDDGTVTGGAGTDTLTATFPAGYRFVKLTVTDSNGKTDFMEVLVYADDPADSDCVAFQCVEHRVTKDGQSCAFRIMEDIAITDYPDGTMVIFWDGEPASASDRSNVKFWGWHYSNQNTTAAQETGTLKDVVLQCVDGAGKLDTLPSFPQSVQQNPNPTTWLEMSGLNMDLYIDYLFRWHSNAFNLMYYTPSGTGSAFPMVVIGSDGESILDQCQRRAAALVPDYLLTCNRHGELKTVPNPILQDTGDRTATSQATLTAANWTAISWQRTRPPRYHWIWGSAVLASATQILARFCTAPGQAPGQGLNEQNSGEQLTQSQDDLNACEGHRYAYINAFNGQVVVSLPTDTGIEPAAGTWVTLTVDAAYTRRVLGFSSARGLPIELNITYDYQRTGVTTAVELIWELETDGPPAVTYVPPEPDWDWEPPPVIIPPPPTTTGTGFGTCYVLLLNFLIRTRDLSAVSPVWVDISDSWVDASDFILDPHDPTGTALVLEEDGSVWKSTGLAGSSPTFTKVVIGAGIDAFKIIGSINVANYFAYVYRSGDIYAKYTTDHWSSDNDVSIHAPDGEAHVEGAFDYVPHLGGSGVIMYVAVDEAGETQHQGVLVFKSIDSGATWNLMANLGTTIGGNDLGDVQAMHVPYNDNPNGDIVFLGTSSGTGTGLYRSTNGGRSFTNIAPGADIEVVRQGVETWTQNRQILYYWDDLTLNISVNGGTSFSTPAMTGFPADGVVVASGGFPYKDSQYYAVVFGGTSEGIFVTVDGGENWIDKTGNAASLGVFGAGVEAVQQRQAVIVPLWTE